MLDQPRGADILGAVAALLRDVLVPQLQGSAAFQARVAANAVDLVAREMTQGPAAEAASLARLRALLGHDGPAAVLEAELADAIAGGRLPDDHPGLQAHLWAITMDKLAIDQPSYAPYRDSLRDAPCATPRATPAPSTKE